MGNDSVFMEDDKEAFVYDTENQPVKSFSPEIINPIEAKLGRYYLNNLIGKHYYLREFVSALRCYINMDLLNKLLKKEFPGFEDPTQMTDETFISDNSNIEIEFMKIVEYATLNKKMDIVESLLKQYLNASPEALEEIKTVPRYKNIIQFYHLDNAEFSLLVFLDLAEKLLGELLELWGSKFLLKAISICTSVPLQDVQRCLKYDSVLIRSGIVRLDTCIESEYKVNKRFLDFFPSHDPLHSFLKKINISKSDNLDDFMFNPRHIEIGKYYLNQDQSSQLLACEAFQKKLFRFAQSLIYPTNSNVFVFNTRHDCFSNQEPQTISYLITAMIPQVCKDSIIIIPYAELISKNSIRYSILAKIRKELKKRNIKIFWLISLSSIAGQIKEIADFTFDFKDIDKEMAISYFSKKLSNLAINMKTKESIVRLLATSPELRKIFSKLYRFLALLAKKNLPDETAAKYIRDYLTAQKIVDDLDSVKVNGTSLYFNKKMLNKVVQSQESRMEHYSIDVLETSIKASKILTSMRNAISLSQERREAIEYKILFYGAPGTGKTAFAHHIAHSLNKELVIVRYSDIANAYIGRTEKNIVKCFKSTDYQNSILLIDEIDSFLFNRKNASRPWEISHVNEFLTQMDSYQGIFIATTNNLNLLDEAVLRRFQQKVEFYALSNNGFRILLQTYFPDESFSESDIANLWKHNPYYPSDFQVAKKNVLFLEPGDIKKDIIMDTLMHEARLRNQTGKRTIGFTA